MNVLDPFEVAEIEVWPFWELNGDNQSRVILNQAEFTVYQNALKQSDFQTILNEKEILETELLDFLKSIRGTVLPEDARLLREHPDTRLARRA